MGCSVYQSTNPADTNIPRALIEAVNRIDIPSVANLMTQGAHPFLCDSSGRSAFDYAKRLGPEGLELRARLIEQCPRFHVLVSDDSKDAPPQHNHNSLPSYIIHNSALLEAFRNKDPKTFKRLLKSPLADIACKGSQNTAPLWLALRDQYKAHLRNHPAQPNEPKYGLLKKIAVILPSLFDQHREPTVQLYHVLIAHERRLRNAKKLTNLDLLLRAIVEEKD